MDGLITEFYHNIVVPYSEPPEEDVRQYCIRGFSTANDSTYPSITAIPVSRYEFIYYKASQPWGIKMLLCGQY